MQHRLPLTLRLPPFGYGFRVEGTDGRSAERTGYCIISTKEARGSIKTNKNHVRAAAELSARLRFHEWGNIHTTRVHVVTAWFHSKGK